MQNKFTQKAQNVLIRASKTAQELGHTYIGSEHLLLALLYESGSVAAKMLAKRGAIYEKLRSDIVLHTDTGTPTRLSSSDMTPRVKRIIESASYESIKNGHNYIGTEHLLLALLDEQDCLAVRALEQSGISVIEMKNDILVFMTSSAEKNPAFLSRTKARSSQTQALLSFGRSLNALVTDGKTDPVIARDNETERLIQILSRRTKNNPCLIGEPGVGKTAVVEGLAERIVKGNVPDMLKNKTVFALDLPSMIAGAKYRGEFEERMKSVMAECAKDPSIILFIDEIHTIIGAGSAEGAIDAANIIKPPLSRGELQIIGATTISEYRKHVEKDPALERRFQAVNINEPTPEATVRILFGLRDKYESHHRLKISDEAIYAAVDLSQKYINDRYLPDKAIDLIDEAASRLRIAELSSPTELVELENRLKQASLDKEEAVNGQNFEEAARYRDEESALKKEYEDMKLRSTTADTLGGGCVSAEDIAEIVTLWTSIPVSRLLEEEGQKLKRLEKDLSARVIGQDRAISEISRAIRRSRLGIKSQEQPIGSFIFVGPTGVGKTVLCKALSEIMFGNESAMIRLDMSEYMEKHSVSRLIGAPPGYIGYDEGGQLTERVRRRPFSLILFDEIEKAHPDVFNIMLQILEDGILTDSQGRSVSFRNALIIMTSNLGSEDSQNARSLGFSSSKEDGRAVREEKIRRSLASTFRPEFLNRIDEIIFFEPLEKDSVIKITHLMLDQLSKRLSKAGIRLDFDISLTERIANEGFDERLGARPIRRAIRRLIEDPLAVALLNGSVQRGSRLTASFKDGNTAFSS